jgi:ribonuclease HI
MRTRQRITAYTDGACSGNPGPGGWACEVNGILHEGGTEWATNNEMEMLAVIRTLEECPGFTELTIHTDSKLVIGWLSLGWKSRSNPNITDLIKTYHAIREARDIVVKFIKVKGHSTNAGNNRVDQAAFRQSQALKRARLYS